MRYKCIGSPHCLKTFEYGHALRAHTAACDKAQTILKSRASVEKMEYEISVAYHGITGLHRNPYYPTAHHVDQSMKFEFADRTKFRYPPTGSSSSVDADAARKAAATAANSSPRRIRKAVNSTVHSSNQVKMALSYQS